MAQVHSSQINPTGSFEITGSLSVEGQTTLEQTASPDPALIGSGAMEIVEAQLQSQIQRARLTIQNLGSMGDRANEDTIDLGGFF